MCLNLKIFQTGNPGLEDFKDFKSSKSAYVFSTPADKSINVENDEKDLVKFYKRYLFAQGQKIFKNYHRIFSIEHMVDKLSCVFPIIVVSILSHADSYQITIGKTHPTLYNLILYDMSTHYCWGCESCERGLVEKLIESSSRAQFGSPKAEQTFSFLM